MTYGTETRRFLLGEDMGYESLREKVAGLYPSLQGRAKDLVLGYCDSDGDIIAFSSDEELSTAVSTHPDSTSPLRILVRVPSNSCPGPSPQHTHAHPPRVFHPFHDHYHASVAHDHDHRHHHPQPQRSVGLFSSFDPFGFGGFLGGHGPGFDGDHDHHFGSGLLDLDHWMEDRQRDLRRREEYIRRKREAEENAYRQQVRAAIQQRARAAAAAAQQQQAQAQSTAGAEDSAPESSKAVKTTEQTQKLSTPSGDLYYHTFGSWEPTVYESPFWRKTVVGPVGYQMSWTWPPQEQKKEGGEGEGEAEGEGGEGGEGGERGEGGEKEEVMDSEGAEK